MLNSPVSPSLDASPAWEVEGESFEAALAHAPFALDDELVEILRVAAETEARAPTSAHSLIVRQYAKQKRGEGSTSSAVGGGTVRASSAEFQFEIMMVGQSSNVVRSDGRIVRRTPEAGIRVTVEITDIKGDFSLNLVAISAATRVGLATASFNANPLGFPKAAGPLGNAPGPGSLREETGLNKVLGYVKAMKDYMATNPAKMTLVEHFSEIGNRAKDGMEEARSVAFAMRMIKEKKTEAEAIQKAAAVEADPDVIRAVYQRTTGDLTGLRKPSKAHRSEAREWLSV